MKPCTTNELFLSEDDIIYSPFLPASTEAPLLHVHGPNRKEESLNSPPPEETFVQRVKALVKITLWKGLKSGPVPAGWPRPVAILVGGLNSWWGDDTFEHLQDVLTNDLRFEVIRFSYNGIEYPSYGNFDSLKPLRDLCDYFDAYMTHYPRPNDQVPVFVFAHSLGGLVVANWLCRPEPPRRLSQIDKLFLFASPVIVPPPALKFPVKHKGHSVMFDLTPYYVTKSLLIQRFHNIVVVRGTNDDSAPKDQACLSDPDLDRGSLADKEFDIEHEKIAGDREVTAFVRNCLEKDLRKKK